MLALSLLPGDTSLCSGHCSIGSALRPRLPTHMPMAASPTPYCRLLSVEGTRWAQDLTWEAGEQWPCLLRGSWGPWGSGGWEEWPQLCLQPPGAGVVAVASAEGLGQWAPAAALRGPAGMLFGKSLAVPGRLESPCQEGQRGGGGCLGAG